MADLATEQKGNEAIPESSQGTADVYELDEAALGKLEESLSEETGGEQITPGAGDVSNDPQGETKDPQKEKPKEVSLADVSARLDKAEKQISDKENFIQRQGNEIGDLKALVGRSLGANGSPGTALPDMTELAEDPKKFNEHVKATVAQEIALRDLKTSDAERKRYDVERVVRERFPDFDELLPDIIESAQEIEPNQQNVEMFKRDPFLASSGILLSLASRAKERRGNKELVKKLDDVLGTNKKQAQNLKDAAGESLPIGQGVSKSNPGNSGNAGKVTATRVTTMSDAELDKLENSLT